jgi:rRNA maturation endonuclease Nob1
LGEGLKEKEVKMKKEKEIRYPVYKCKGCHNLTSISVEKCPRCGQKMEFSIVKAKESEARKIRNEIRKYDKYYFY